MSIWGKIIGGTAGLALGGPLGALIGTAAGHAIDKITSKFSNSFEIFSESDSQIFLALSGLLISCAH